DRGLVGRRGAVPVDAVAVRHHDEQLVLVPVEELLAEEVRVHLRLPEEYGNRAEVDPRRDDGDADLEAGLLRRREQRRQLARAALVDVRVERQEHRLCDQVVARGVGVSVSWYSWLGISMSSIANESVTLALRTGRPPRLSSSANEFGAAARFGSTS